MTSAWISAWLLLLHSIAAGTHDEPGLDGPPPALSDCDERLARAGVRTRPASIRPHPSPDRGFTCGAPQVVRYLRGPGSIRYGNSPKLTCQMALAMGDFERIVQDVARRELRRPVVLIEHVGTYNCRAMAAYPDWVSEHSYANAIDIRAFVLRGGRRISVRHDYGREPDAPDTRAGRFLREVARQLYDEGVFSVVLTPAFDGAHRSHFHLDRAPYRVDGTGR